MFDDGKVADVRLAASIQADPGPGGGRALRKTGEVQRQNNWIKTVS
jgi:hypothetical protein